MGKQWKTAGKQLHYAKKAALFTKLSKAIQVATRLGGKDPNNNHRLQLALNQARQHSLPKETINRAIQKGQGLINDTPLEEMLFEGFASYGVAVLAHCLTDNRIRTTSEIRFLFKSHSGHLAENGSVLWMFDPVAIITASPPPPTPASKTPTPPLATAEPEDVALAIDAIDIKKAEAKDSFVFYANKNDLLKAQKKLASLSWVVESAKLAYLPKTPLVLNDINHKQQIKDFLHKLTYHPDCQDVHSNLKEQ